MVTVEGFDHMSSPDLMRAKMWDWVPDAINFWNLSFAAGRNVGRCVQIGDNIGQYGSVTMQLAKILPATYTQFVCGFAFQMQRLPHLGGNPPTIWWFSNPSNSPVFEVKVTTDQRLMVAGLSSAVGSMSAGA